MNTRAYPLVVSHPKALSTRHLVRPIFRYRRIGVAVFGLMSTAVVACALLWPASYRSQMKILVTRERMDPVLRADGNTGTGPAADVTDNDVFSEVELLKSRDVLEQVARNAGLVAPQSGGGDTIALARAVQGLASGLKVQPAKKSTIIEVSYESRDPQQAARVLTTLSQAYLDKQLAVRRPSGSRDFFAQQTERLRTEVQRAQQQLVAFGKEHGLISASAEKDSALQQIAAFEAIEAQLRAQLADVRLRQAALMDEAATTPRRLTTSVRTQDNGELMRDLKTRVLELESKRAEMLPKFADSYPPLVEIEAKLQQARDALASAQATPLRDETTDQNPTYQWEQNELARSQAEEAALKARLASTVQTVSTYQRKAAELDEYGVTQQALLRAVKAAEENYSLYERKAEESRISDALDRSHIANVAIAEPPNIPALPANGNRLLLAFLGLVLAVISATAATFTADFLNPMFRSPEEIQTVLDVTVLATLPLPAAR